MFVELNEASTGDIFFINMDFIVEMEQISLEGHDTFYTAICTLELEHKVKQSPEEIIELIKQAKKACQ